MANTTGKKFGGRKKGTANKATMQAKEAIAKFVDGNADRLVLWLDQIAEENPKDAFNCFMSVVEYHIPKLQRTESNINHGGEVQLNAKVSFVDGKLSNTE